MTHTLPQYTLDDVTEEFAARDLFRMRLYFDSQSSFDAYREIADRLTSEYTDRLVAHLDDTDSDRTALYKHLRSQFGNKTAPKGNKWGAINDITSCGGGVRWVDCVGHGGFLVSRPRQECIPVSLRDVEWAYEEDCDYAIVGAIFPETAMKSNPRFFDDRETTRRHCAERVVRYYGADTIGRIVGGEDVVSA